VASYGLIAGMSVHDMRRSCPGYVLDMYVYRQRYDDEQHGIRRKRQGGEW